MESVPMKKEKKKMTPKVKVTVGLETYYIRKDDEVALLEFLEHLEGSDHIE